MKIDYFVLHRNLKITLTSGETLYGRTYPDGEDSYFVYEYFGGKRREIPEAAILSYETFREDDIAAKVKAYGDMEKMCGEDPVFHLRVLDFALDILSEVLEEKKEAGKTAPSPREEAEAEARRRLKGEGGV